MPTIPVDITKGIEYSATQGQDAGTKMHNFMVGQDGAVYKMPILRNLVDIGLLDVWRGPTQDPSRTTRVYDKMADVLVYDETEAEKSVTEKFWYTNRDGRDEAFIVNMYRYDPVSSVAFLSQYGHGNFSYFRRRLRYPSNLGGPYEVRKETLLNLGTTSTTTTITMAIAYTRPRLVHDKETNRLIAPANWLFLPHTINIPNPKNMISFPLGTGNPAPLTLNNVPFRQDDSALGAFVIGNRMCFYSRADISFADRTVKGALVFSQPNQFTKLQSEQGSQDLFVREPAEAVVAITDFNGNVILFTVNGIDRWVLAVSRDPSAIRQLVQKDPTFHYDLRIKSNSSFVKADRDLYFATRDNKIYKLAADLSITEVFPGVLQPQKPIQEYLDTSLAVDMAYFEILGEKVITIGPWMYSIRTGKWNTYSYDGYLDDPPIEPDKVDANIYNDNTSRSCAVTGKDTLICLYRNISVALTYEEMELLPAAQIAKNTSDALQQPAPRKWEDAIYGHQWGQFAFFTTAKTQQVETFSLDGIYANVRGGVLLEEAELLLMILNGDDEGLFDHTQVWQADATAQAAYRKSIGAVSMKYRRTGKNIGRFEWRTNITTDTFRLQFLTNEVRGMVIQSVFANITTQEDIETN